MSMFITLAIALVIAGLLWVIVDMVPLIPALFKTLIKILILLAVVIYLASMAGFV